MFEKLVNFMDSFLEMGIPGCDCIAYKDGKQVFRYMTGYSDLENKIPINGTERYNIYSCSKPITCVAAMQLWEQGQFSLEDKLSDGERFTILSGPAMFEGDQRAQAASPAQFFCHAGRYG